MCTPTAEICDGVDNSCNGQTDEGGLCNTTTNCGRFGNACAPGWPCTNGACVNPPTTSFCYYLNASGSRMPAGTLEDTLYFGSSQIGYHGIVTQNGTFGQLSDTCISGNVMRSVCGAIYPYTSGEGINGGTRLLSSCSNGCSAGSCITPPVNSTTNVTNSTVGNSSFRCTGFLPENAHLCLGDDQGLTVNRIIALREFCFVGDKCEAICNQGFLKFGDACELPTTTMTTCTDSDGGVVANTGGTATTNSSSVPEDRRVLTDSCQNSTLLNETFCYSYGGSSFPWWAAPINCANATNPGFTCIDPDGQAGPLAAYCG